MLRFDDHCLPLVQLKERRRDLVRALRLPQHIHQDLIAEIASVQLAIKAIEEVADDMDDEAHISLTDDFAFQSDRMFSLSDHPIVASVAGDHYYEI
jgi:N-methylhydantoinase B/oxoprolinase/acetone carboxylase alpha subunit